MKLPVRPDGFHILVRGHVHQLILGNLGRNPTPNTMRQKDSPPERLDPLGNAINGMGKYENVDPGENGTISGNQSPLQLEGNRLRSILRRVRNQHHFVLRNAQKQLPYGIREQGKHMLGKPDARARNVPKRAIHVQTHRLIRDGGKISETRFLRLH